MFGADQTTSTEFQSTDGTGRWSLLKRAIAIVSAVSVTAGLLFVYAFLVRRNAERLRAQTEAQNPVPKPSPSPLVQLFRNEAMIKGTEAVIGGTVQNISPETLTGLSVEIELKRRRDGVSELRVVSVEPRDLGPQQNGYYSLRILSRDYRAADVHRITSTRSPEGVPFKVLEGAARPDERLPTKETTIVRPPSKGGNREEFINTPDNPATVP